MTTNTVTAPPTICAGEVIEIDGSHDLLFWIFSFMEDAHHDTSAEWLNNIWRGSFHRRKPLQMPLLLHRRAVAPLKKRVLSVTSMPLD
jgi:hypothetical protein